jgi:nitrate reductase alpha subunit
MSVGCRQDRVKDNDWIEVVNRNGVVASPGDRVAPDARGHGLHAPRAGPHIDVPLTETDGKRGGIHNSLTRILIKPSHIIGGYAQLAYFFNYIGPTGNNRTSHDDPQADREGGVLTCASWHRWQW